MHGYASRGSQGTNANNRYTEGCLLDGGKVTVEAAMEARYDEWPTTLNQWAHACMYFLEGDYDIELVDSDGLTQAMPQVKWRTPLGSIPVYLLHGPTIDFLYFTMRNLSFFIAIETLLSFLKDTFYGSGSTSLAAKSDLIDDDKGALFVSSKGKESIDAIREGTHLLCPSKG
ncbi:hypothetical protein D1007_18963 [Hordeum vulgare]|nr:hypothetical protein D1007_18963 [Hordeum vulgare]